MKKMTEVLVHLSGNLPRSEELFGVLRRYGKGEGDVGGGQIGRPRRDLRMDPARA